MEKVMKKLFISILLALMLTSCASKKQPVAPVDEDHDGRTYIALIENYQPRKKNTGSWH